MRALREMGGGLIIAVLSLLLVIGGISLSLAENTPPEQPTPTPLPPILATSIDLPTLTPIIVASTNTVEASTPTTTFTVAPSATQAAPVAVCNPPAGWIQITVNASDTLYTIAERYKTTAEILSGRNCLNNTIPAIGSRLYVPPIPTVTVIPCGPFAGWVRAYTVKPGDNLYRISLLYRTTVQQLQRANCMGSSTIIYTGQVLWVPNVATSTPGVTVMPNTATPSATLQPTSTFIVTDSPMPSATTAPTNTSVPPTSTASLTSIPSPTPTPNTPSP